MDLSPISADQRRAVVRGHEQREFARRKARGSLARAEPVEAQRLEHGLKVLVRDPRRQAQHDGW